MDEHEDQDQEEEDDDEKEETEESSWKSMWILIRCFRDVSGIDLIWLSLMLLQFIPFSMLIYVDWWRREGCRTNDLTITGNQNRLK
jgi:hypothetical protein